MDRYSLTIELRNGNETFLGAANFSAPNVAGEMTIKYDATGAVYYVTAVIVFYGLSMILLIASLSAKQAKDKLFEYDEAQLNRYLNKAHLIKERGIRDSIKEVKKSIISVVNHGGESSDSCDDISVLTAAADRNTTENEMPNVQNRSSLIQNRRMSCPASMHPTIPEEGSDCSQESVDQLRLEQEQLVSVNFRPDYDHSERITVQHCIPTYQSNPYGTSPASANTSIDNTFNINGTPRQIPSTCCCKINHGQSVTISVATNYRQPKKTAIPVNIEEELIQVTCV